MARWTAKEVCRTPISNSFQPSTALHRAIGRVIMVAGCDIAPSYQLISIPLYVVEGQATRADLLPDTRPSTIWYAYLKFPPK